jgi:putative transposase
MAKLTYVKRVWIIKQYNKGVPASEIALAQKINKRRVYQIIDKYKEFDWEGLKDLKTGRPEISLNAKVADTILDIRKKYEYGACHIEQILRQKGFKISHRQIEKLLLRSGLVKSNIKKQKCCKWVRYELPNPNDLAHTDWSYDPFTQKQFSAYIDDRTRLITSFGLFNNATTENSIALLKSAIAEYGKPKAIMTDHGSQFYANRLDAIEQKTEFRIVLDILGIKHYVARVNRPQTNGKIERFFLTYKTEYATGSFKNITDYINHYNKERLHMSLNYKTPQEIWNELKKV